MIIIPVPLFNTDVYILVGGVQHGNNGLKISPKIETVVDNNAMANQPSSRTLSVRICVC